MKRGMLFTITIFVVTVFLLIQGYLILLGKNNEISGGDREIGTEQRAVLNAQSQIDDAMLYLDASMHIAAWEAVYDLARIGYPTTCGRDNGIPLLSTPTQSIRECALPAPEKLSSLIQTKLNKLLNLHPLWINIDHVSVVPREGGIDVYGSSNTLLDVVFSDKRGHLSENPRSHVTIDYQIGDYTAIGSVLTEMTSRCAQDDPEPCVRDLLESMSQSHLRWGLGSCEGVVPLGERNYAFCIRTAEKHSLYRDGALSYAPIAYTLAVHIPARTPLHIKEFRINGLPTSGNPLDKATLALSRGFEISYSGVVRSPSPDIAIKICAGSVCEAADTILPSVSGSYTFIGSLASPQGPYAITARAQLGSEHVEATNINVLFSA